MMERDCMEIKYELRRQNHTKPSDEHSNVARVKTLPLTCKTNW